MSEPFWKPNATTQPLWPDQCEASIAVFRPEKPDGSAIVVCPGGAYAMLAPHESDPVAEWLNTLGITAIVLRYRLTHHPRPMEDVQRTIQTIRTNADEIKVDPKRVGVLGFSAGGHLAATACVHVSDKPVSSRPDLAVLLYPVIMMDGPSVNTGSRRNLLGEKPTQELVDLMSCEKQVTKDTPPAFIFHTVDDGGVPVENALAYAAALRREKIPFEMHLYEHGKHGVGLAEKDPVLKTWPNLCAAWLKTHNFGRGA